MVMYRPFLKRSPSMKILASLAALLACAAAASACPTASFVSVQQTACVQQVQAASLVVPFTPQVQLQTVVVQPQIVQQSYSLAAPACSSAQFGVQAQQLGYGSSFGQQLAVGGYGSGLGFGQQFVAVRGRGVRLGGRGVRGFGGLGLGVGNFGLGVGGFGVPLAAPQVIVEPAFGFGGFGGFGLGIGGRGIGTRGIRVRGR
jgi:hypothetical protein